MGMSMPEQNQQNEGAWYKPLILIAGPVLFLTVLLLPNPPEMSHEAQRVGAVAVWMAFWWLTGIIHVGATALLPFALFPLLGIMDSAEAVSHFAHWLNFLILGGFLIAAAMQRWGLHRRIALAIIDWIGTTPRRIILGFMVASAFLSLFVTNTATSLMMLPVALAVLDKMREMSDRQAVNYFAPALMLSIAYSCSIGGTGTLIGTGPNGVFASQTNTLYGLKYGFFDWLKIGIPMVVIIIPLAWLIITRVAFRIPAELGSAGGDAIKEERAKLGKLKIGERWTAIVLIFTALCWTFRKPLDVGFFTIPGLQTYMPTINSDATASMVAGVLLFAIPIDKKCSDFVLDMPSALKIPWDILLIIGGGVSLANGFGQSGLSLWIANQLAILGGMHPFIVILLCVAMLVFLTEMTSNTATSTLFLPIMGSIAIGMGQNPLLLMIPCTIGVSMAFMLPVATPPNAVVFGSGMIKAQEMARTGLLMNIIAITMITLIFYFLVLPFTGIDLNQVPEWAT